ncbi:MAG TPA: hypothetical protein VMF35_05280 [Acidimicrobiales bacterium]|nr:hypothetical protein [Acidimicrobiales bacterium]
MPPEVTEGLEWLTVGCDELLDELLVVFWGEVVEVEDEDEEEDEEPEPVEPDSDVEVRTEFLLLVLPPVPEPVVPPPGCSFATTIPMATAAPVATSTAARVNERSRDAVHCRSNVCFGMRLVDIGWGTSFSGMPQSHHGRFDTLAGPAVHVLRQFCPRFAARNRRSQLRSPAQVPASQGEPMSQVNTVRGPVDGAELGNTLMHEHIFVLSPEIEKPSSEWDESAQQAKAVSKLRELKKAGIDTLVDLTVVGLGRYIPRIASIAQQVPEINVVVATGVYTYNEVPMYFHFRGPGTILGGSEPMVDLFVREVEHGIGDTGVRAAILKCATDRPGVTPGVERVLRAVARAHRSTGVPITTHTPTPPEPWGLEQQRIFKEEGVDLSRVVIGHSGGTVNTDYHLQLIDNGSYLGFDHFGLPGITLEERVDAVARLCERGYADRLVLSHDAMCFVDWFPRSIVDASSDWRWTYISDTVLPALRSRGIGESDIARMLVDNPRTILEGGAPY